MVGACVVGVAVVGVAVVTMDGATAPPQPTLIAPSEFLCVRVGACGCVRGSVAVMKAGRRAASLDPPRADEFVVVDAERRV